MAESLDDYISKAKHMEGILESSSINVDKLEEFVNTTQLSDLSNFTLTPEYIALKTENEKLKFQKNHLKKSIEKEMMNSKPIVECNENYMTNIVAGLVNLFKNAIHMGFPELIGNKRLSISVTPSKNLKFGDYQCNSAMNICNLLEGEKKMKSKDISVIIQDNLKSNAFIEKTDIAGPGFINIFLKRSFIAEELELLMTKGVRPPLTCYNKPGCKKRKVVIDMSSPNIAKEMHVGHLRSTIIGEGISQLCSFMGDEVLKLNHLGDWGTQFGMLITHLQQKFPDYKKQAPPIGDLQAFYKESKVRFDNEADFKKSAYQAVVKLQSYDQDYITAWKLICDVSSNEFRKIYKRLDINDLIDRGESFYQPKMADTVKILDKTDMVRVEDGRKICFAPQENMKVPLTLVKSDGGYGYDTSDMTALHQRIFEEKADAIYYVIDSGQSEHLRTCFGVARGANWYSDKTTRIEHVGFGVVLGEDKKKFKTRSGDTVRLSELLDEGLKRSEAKLREKSRDMELSSDEFNHAKEAIAYGCIKYADLSHSRLNDYIFSFDKMLDDKGNTAVYLQYAFMRIRSIVRNTNTLKKDITLKDISFKFEHDREWKLAKQISRFAEIISRVSEDLLLHTLCDYLYDLSSIFTEFYDVCYVVEKDRKTGEIIKINEERLRLCEATSSIMSQCFKILGLRTVERM